MCNLGQVHVGIYQEMTIAKALACTRHMYYAVVCAL